MLYIRSGCRHFDKSGSGSIPSLRFNFLKQAVCTMFFIKDFQDGSVVDPEGLSPETDSDHIPLKPGQLNKWMRSSQVVRASGCQCQSRNNPGLDPSILRHSGIWSGSGMGKNSDPRWTFRIFFLVSVFRLKILNDADPDPGSCQPCIRDGKN